MVEKKVVGEGRLPPWEIAQPHPGRRETHHNQGWKLQFLSKSDTDNEEPNISGKQFWFAFSQPLRRVRAPLGAVLVTVTLSLVPKQIINSILIIMNSQTQLFGRNSYICCCTIFFNASKNKTTMKGIISSTSIDSETSHSSKLRHIKNSICNFFAPFAIFSSSSSLGGKMCKYASIFSPHLPLERQFNQ